MTPQKLEYETHRRWRKPGRALERLQNRTSKPGRTWSVFLKALLVRMGKPRPVQPRGSPSRWCRLGGQELGLLERRVLFPEECATGGSPCRRGPQPGARAGSAEVPLAPPTLLRRRNH